MILMRSCVLRYSGDVESRYELIAKPDTATGYPAMSEAQRSNLATNSSSTQHYHKLTSSVPSYYVVSSLGNRYSKLAIVAMFLMKQHVDINCLWASTCSLAAESCQLAAETCLLAIDPWPITEDPCPIETNPCPIAADPCFFQIHAQSQQTMPAKRRSSRVYSSLTLLSHTCKQ